MAVVSEFKFQPDEIKKEVCELIDIHGLFGYDVKRIVKAGDAVSMEIVLKLYWNPDAEKLVV